MAGGSTKTRQLLFLVTKQQTLKIFSSLDEAKCFHRIRKNSHFCVCETKISATERHKNSRKKSEKKSCNEEKRRKISACTLRTDGCATTEHDNLQCCRFNMKMKWKEKKSFRDIFGDCFGERLDCWSWCAARVTLEVFIYAERESRRRETKVGSLSDVARVITDGSSVDGKDQADWNLSDVVLRNARASLPSRDLPSHKAIVCCLVQSQKVLMMRLAKTSPRNY